jgi:signal transduction histidine kinase
VCLKIGDLKKSKQYLDEAETIATNIQAKNTLLEIYPVMIEWYESQGRLKESLVYYKKYNLLKDSVYNRSLSNRITSLQSEYTILQKNQEIEILNKDKALREQALETEQSRVRQQRIIIISGVLILLLGVGGSYVVYRNYKKVTELNKKIQENSEEMQAQAEELQVSNQMIAQINEGLEEMVESRTKELKQAYKELDTFFYRSSHDFRRPLTTFMGLAEVAKITITDIQALGLFEKVNETARGLDKMLIKLQSISDVGSTQLIFKQIYFDEIFNNVLDVFRDEIKHKDIRVTTQVNLSTVFTSYPGLIKVIVENLLENSITFSHSHKSIKLVVYSVQDGITIEVEDNGYGIEAEYLERVFEMYFRGHEQSKGNGLGLYIVKRVVEKLGGQITLTSHVGTGTVVRVFLPNQAHHVGNQ